MDPQIQKIQLDVEERILILPEDIREIITLDILDDFLQDIQLEYSLSTGQTRILETEIMLVLMCFFPRKDLFSRINAVLNIEPSIAQDIATKTNIEIFALVSDILSEIEVSFDKDIPTMQHTETTPVFEKASAITTQPEMAQEQIDTPTPHIETIVQPVVEPLRTMEHDMDRIHGYGSYRKLYPDVEVAETIEAPVVSNSAETLHTSQQHMPSQLPQANAPVGYAQAAVEQEQTVQSLSQEEMLNRPPLADTPSYSDPNKQS